MLQYLLNHSQQMYYGTGDLSVISHGNTQENETKFPLAASEYVTMIEGSVTAGAISQLTFVTNKRMLTTMDYDGEHLEC